MTIPLGGGKINTSPCTKADEDRNWRIVSQELVTINNFIDEGGDDANTVLVSADDTTAQHLHASFTTSATRDTTADPLIAFQIASAGANETVTAFFDVSLVPTYNASGTYALCWDDGVPTYIDVTTFGGSGGDNFTVQTDGSDTLPGYLMDKLYHQETFDEELHQEVYAAVIVDGSERKVQLFTVIGEETYKVLRDSSDPTPEYIADKIHDDSFEATDTYDADTHFVVLVAPISTSDLRFYAPYNIIKTSDSDGSPDYLFDKFATQGTYNVSTDQLVSFEDTGSTLRAFFTISDVNTDELVAVSAGDASPGYLHAKLADHDVYNASNHTLVYADDIGSTVRLFTTTPATGSFDSYKVKVTSAEAAEDADFLYNKHENQDTFDADEHQLVYAEVSGTKLRLFTDLTDPSAANEQYRLIRGQVVQDVEATDPYFFIDNIVPLANGLDPSSGNPGAQIRIANLYDESYSEDDSVVAVFSDDILTAPVTDWEPLPKSDSEKCLGVVRSEIAAATFNAGELAPATVSQVEKMIRNSNGRYVESGEILDPCENRSLDSVDAPEDGFKYIAQFSRWDGAWSFDRVDCEVAEGA